MSLVPIEPPNRLRAKPGPLAGPPGCLWTYHSGRCRYRQPAFDPNSKGAGRFFGAKTHSDLAQRLIRPLDHCSYRR